MSRRIIAAAAAASFCVGCTEVVSSERTGAVSMPIFDGQPAMAEQIYSTVSVGTHCTGTLIAPRVVLTAAHCFFNDAGMRVPVETVYAGELDFNDGAPFAVAEEAPHDGYNPYMSGELGAFHDIGLLILQAPIEQLPVAPVLPSDQLDAHIQPGTMLTVSGYGMTGDSPDNSALYIAETPFQEHNGTELYAGGSGHPDTCSGDSGGPIYIVVDGTRYVTGVTSRAYGMPASMCEDAGGIYTLAGAYDSFLRDSSDGAYPSPAPPSNDAEDGCCIVAAGAPNGGAAAGLWLALGLLVAARVRRQLRLW